MKKKQQKTREPYGKVTEVGQVPIALQEIRELAKANGGYPNRMQILEILDSVIAVTCANPGCLSQMAEGLPHRELQVAASGSLTPEFDLPACPNGSFVCHGCDAVIE